MLYSCSNSGQKTSGEIADSSTEFTIDYEKFTLDNGLEVILHQDHSDPIIAVATMMHVGSSREKPGKTGFAHFFEHMSFNDSENTPVGANRKLIPEWGKELVGMTELDFKSIINKENKMIYVVVGDKATQFEEIKKLLN